MEPIYLDHAATSPVDKRVLDEMIPYFSMGFGNPSSTHLFGRKAKQALIEARARIAHVLGANANEIILTSGGTEANNLALVGYVRANAHKGKHLITTEIEHHAILHTIDQLEQEGFSVTRLPVDSDGRISIADLQDALTDETIVVSIMFGNNEVGTLQPIVEIGELVADHQAVFHTDAVQAAGILSIDVKALKIDMASISSHKLNGPKGIGCLYLRENIEIQPMFFGGEQEKRRRAGTENVSGAVGFARAFELAAAEYQDRASKYTYYRSQFFAIMNEYKIKVTENGSDKYNLPHILNVCFDGVKTEALLMQLDLLGIAASGGSACTAGTHLPSHVIEAMYGKESNKVDEAIRFSFGLGNTDDQLEFAFNAIAKAVRDAHQQNAFIE
ncbi:LOW QUALITY PROTEIN: cysteine desulfurase [Bacillus sp. JCM 19045]|nr:LOW QUALITY PROTEIN: cysteine desulfurase [Bacillus sp. JCM 19045]